MIKFKKNILSNGLTVLTHQDPTTPMAAVNVLYKVGSRNEDENKTGFAHLFEHLMFGGSANVPDFDEVIQDAGGENNAYTNNDYTSFYELIPAQNLESALWVEADRMANLVLSEKSLDVQRKVVIEEFKEVCLNTPYGETWHHLSSLAYKHHPYNWPTIGKVPEHIEEASIGDVQSFFGQYYNPGNAILSIASPLSNDEMLELARKWFGEIEDGPRLNGSLPKEPKQTEKRHCIIQADVPIKALYMAFHMPDRLDPKYYACDLISDLLSNGKSSRLFQRMVKKRQIFSQVDAYISGTFDPGLFIVDGKIMPEESVETAKQLIWEELEHMKAGNFSEDELTKVKNKVTTEIILSNLDILNKAMMLSYFEAISDAKYANDQITIYKKVDKDDIVAMANQVLLEENLSELIYLPMAK